MKEIDLIIKNILVLGEKQQINSVAISDGIILDIDKTNNISKRYEAQKVIDGTDKILMPGFVNSHSHVAMSYFKGLADDLPLNKWLEQYIWPLEKNFMSKDFIKDAALFGCAEMIKNGITIFNDMYFFGEQTAESAGKIGMRAVLGEGILDFPVANYNNADEIFAYIKLMHKKFKDDELIDFAVAPHAIYSCGKESLIKARNLAENLGILLHIHLSETKQEVEDCLKQHGKRPVEYLDELGLFKVDVVAAHGIWINETEQNILSENEVSIAINTSSNLKLASGFDSFKRYLDKGINLAIGSDGVASNNSLSIFQEMNITAKLQKALNNDPTILPANKMVEIATLGGAKALKKSKQLGSIEIGKKADLILVDINNLESQPMYDPYSQLVYSLRSEQIKDVIINGKLIMENRKLLTIDEEQLIDKAKFYQKKIINYIS